MQKIVTWCSPGRKNGLYLPTDFMKHAGQGWRKKIIKEDDIRNTGICDIRMVLLRPKEAFTFDDY